MQAGPGRSLLRALAGHLAMGGGLGAFLAVSLMIGDGRPIAAMILNSAAPGLTTLVFVGIFASVFAVGAAITGLLFVSMEEK
jgi:hypothetical protein